MAQLVCADLSNIEGRVAAWLADETWKLDAFRAYDEGVGPDLYKLAYSRSFGVPPEQVSDEQRQVGKVQELALGYAGGVGAFVTFAEVYRIDLEDMAFGIKNTADIRLWNDAAGMWEWALKKRKTLGLDRGVFIACDTIKRAWREAHPAIEQMWKGLETAWERACDTPGRDFPVGKVVIRKDKSWLTITLPSGRKLCYPFAKAENGKLTYQGVNQYSRKWGTIQTYGGKLFENICQAVARDVMAANMPAIEAAGYSIGLTVHDEVVTSSDGDADGLVALLTHREPWMEGLPLAAKGFAAKCYRKE